MVLKEERKTKKMKNTAKELKGYIPQYIHRCELLPSWTGCYLKTAKGFLLVSSETKTQIKTVSGDRFLKTGKPYGDDKFGYTLVYVPVKTAFVIWKEITEKNYRNGVLKEVRKLRVLEVRDNEIVFSINPQHRSTVSKKCFPIHEWKVSESEVLKTEFLFT